MQLPHTDEILFQSFVRGDHQALGELARRYEARLLGLCRGLLGGSAELALDAVQETWIRVIRFSGSFKAQSSIKTWLYRIAINQCRTIQTSRRRHRQTAIPDPIPAPTDDAIEQTEDQLLLQHAVARLPMEKRAILLLCYHRGMTHEHAAQILDIPVGTLKSRLHSALSELRSILKPNDSELAHEQRA